MSAAPRLFGTNGIREVVGETLTAPFVVRVVRAIGAVVPPRSRLAVGWDGRTSSSAIAQLVTATLTLAGHSVVELGFLPTPAVQYSVPRLGVSLGIIVTASHNPPRFNGIKCIAADGLEATREVEEAIERAFAAEAGASAPFAEVGAVSFDRMGAERYLEGILAQVDRDRIAGRKCRVVLDCANGTAAATGPELLRRLGCTTDLLNGTVDGTFPGRPSEPTEANLSELCRTVPEVGAELGIAHDGDADRAAFVDHRGRFVPGDLILGLLARDAVERRGGGVVVTPVTSSRSLEEIVRAAGGTVEYTRVGSPAITRAMERTGAVFGGEDNGGYVRPGLHLARDGAMSAAWVLDLLARSGTSLDRLTASLPRYAMVKATVDCPVAARATVLERLAQDLGREGTRVDTLDGLKIYWEDDWLLLRPSGTEPIFRVVAESRDAGRAQSLADRGIAAVRAAVGARAPT